MPFCPKCKSEYRDGFTKCSDCGSDLIEIVNEPELSNTNHNNVHSVREVFLLNILDTVEWSYITSLLQEANIPFRSIYEYTGQYLQILHGRNFLGRNLYVRESDYLQAIKIVKSYKSEILPGYEAELLVESSYDIKANIGIQLFVVFKFLLGIPLGVI